MVYEKHIIRTETDRITKYMVFCGKYNRDYAQVLKMQHISLLPEHL